jgi:hypothetical protein
MSTFCCALLARTDTARLALARVAVRGLNERIVVCMAAR